MEVFVQFCDGPLGHPQNLLHPSPGAGALVEFQGIVRGSENGAPIGALRYELYPPMAEREIRLILEELSAAHPCEAVAVVHRWGPVPVGECAIYVGISSAHRQEGFRMLSAFMDAFKQRVPIWKTEVLPC